MSVPIWWTFAKGMVREYPANAAELGELHAVGLTAKYSLEPPGGGPGRTTEAVALRELPPDRQKHYDAVRTALERLVAMPDGVVRLRLVQIYYWDTKTKHTLSGVAIEIGISDSTARRWNGIFLRQVAIAAGVLTER